MKTEQFDILASMMERIAVSLEIIAGQQSQSKPSTSSDLASSPSYDYEAHADSAVAEVAASFPVATALWISPDVPVGYNTIVGYLAENHPEVLDLMPCVVSGTIHDGYWLTHQANRAGLPVAKVAAPVPFREAGIDQINAYPVALLAKRLD